MFLYLFKKKSFLVSQDVILFDDTIKNNIIYANNNASESEINSACELLQQINLSKNFQMDMIQ